MDYGHLVVGHRHRGGVQRDFNVGIQISGRSYYVLFSAASDVCLHRTDTDVLRKQD